MSHFKIMGGDLPKTTALITVFGALQLSAPRPGFTLRTDTYDLKNNIALIEQITEDNKNKVLSKAGWHSCRSYYWWEHNIHMHGGKVKMR